MKLFIVMKKIKNQAGTIHAVWATESQANEVVKRCNKADNFNQYYVDDAYELNNEMTNI